MPFEIIRNDITKVKADVIVNTANPRAVIGAGTDSAIYHAAGEKELLAERKKIGDIAPGQAVETPAFGLQAKYIIHTVGPVWIDGNHGERETLHSCYRNSLNLADKLKAESIAFPLIATGVYGFPKDEALNIALQEIGSFLLTHEMQVILVVFDRKSFELSGSLIRGINQYIDEHGVGLVQQDEYSWAEEDNRSRRRNEISRREELRRMQAQRYANMLPMEETTSSQPEDDPFAKMKGNSLEKVMETAGDTFPKRLFKLIDERGMDDVTVYKKANIDRKVFSKIKCKEKYRPKKETAVAFAIALELDLEETQNLLATAGLALSPSNLSDLIISYFLTNGIYDINEINTALWSYKQPPLGCDKDDKDL